MAYQPGVESGKRLASSYPPAAASRRQSLAIGTRPWLATVEWQRRSESVKLLSRLTAVDVMVMRACLQRQGHSCHPIIPPRCPHRMEGAHPNANPNTIPIMAILYTLRKDTLILTLEILTADACLPGSRYDVWTFGLDVGLPWPPPGAHALTYACQSRPILNTLPRSDLDPA